MKVLITGGLGFIGSNLALECINRGYTVSIIDILDKNFGGNIFNINEIKDKVEINIADIRNAEKIKDSLKGTDIIFNLASQIGHSYSMKYPLKDHDLNSKSQLIFLEQIRSICPEAIIVYTSTRQIYGKAKYLPVDENHPLDPVDINGINKMSAEQFHKLYFKVYGIRSTILRLTNVFGPRMRIKDAKQTFLGIWIKNIIQNNLIDVYGDGSQMRDFVFVTDAVEAIIKAANTKKAYGQIINIGNNCPIQLISLAKKLIKIESNGHYRLVPFPQERKAIDIGNFYTDCSLAESLLSWKSNNSLDDGLIKTIHFYKKYLKYYL